MADSALKMERVYKKFLRGERHDSLRDLIPALARGIFKRGGNDRMTLKKQEFWALSDVSFDIKRGEAVGIIGHNGAGKSTMLKHLSGIMRPTSGRIDVNGRLSALIEVGAGFHPDLSGRDNVFLNGVILGMSRQEIRRKFDEIVEFAGLRDFIDMPVKRYSSGMHARLGFAVAAHLEPDILIIDEVLSVGDYAFQAKGVAKMKSIANNGATVIFVSHNLGAIAGLCPRSLLLNAGRLIKDGPTPDVIGAYMEHVSAERTPSAESDLFIETVALGDENGSRINYKVGEQFNVDVTLRANRPIRNVSCVLYIKDRQHYTIFNTSPDRLGLGLLNMEAGETCTYRFKLTAHLAPGAFHLCVSCLQSDTSNALDVVEPAATFLVESDVEVGGSANLYPRGSILTETATERPRATVGLVRGVK